MSGFDGFVRNIRRQGAPGTAGLIAAFLTSFILAWLFQDSFLPALALKTSQGFMPWTLFTYPFAISGLGGGIIWLLFACWWMWWIGTAVESEVGTPKFLALFFGLSAIAALFIMLGVALMPHMTQRLVSPSLGISALTVIWGTRNPTSCVRLMGCIPVTGAIIAWLDVAITLFGYGAGAPLLGVFAILHLGLAYAYASNRLPFLPYGKGSATHRYLRATEKRDASYFADVRRREQERQERERLRKLFEGGVGDDPGER